MFSKSSDLVGMSYKDTTRGLYRHSVQLDGFLMFNGVFRDSKRKLESYSAGINCCTDTVSQDICFHT